MHRSLLVLVSLALLLALPSCGEPPRPGLLLSGAFFEENTPVPSRLYIARPPANPDDDWSMEVLNAGDGSNVFHKSMYFNPTGGEPGILTIAGAKAPVKCSVKLWRKKSDQWEAETLYEGQYGGGFDRCRDVEIADVNGDGSDDIVVVTHQRGVVIVIEQKGGKYEATEIGGSVESGEAIWIHEVETGDVNGDGTVEFFATPSAPNNLKGKEQPGKLVMYRHEGGEYKETVLEEYTTRHAKEILCCDYDKSGTPWLFASLEGEKIGGGGGGATTLIKCYKWSGDEMTMEDVMSLPGKMCRFLSVADTDGDGTNELIASTKSDGIYSIYHDGTKWKKRTVASGSISSGIEHASIPMDFDGDGKDEIFAVSDKHRVLRRFYFDPKRERYQSEKLLEFEEESLFIFNIEPLPAGM